MLALLRLALFPARRGCRWLRPHRIERRRGTSNTAAFPGIWESVFNPDSNPVEFDGIRIQTGLNSFVLTPKQPKINDTVTAQMRTLLTVGNVKRLK